MLEQNHERMDTDVMRFSVFRSNLPIRCVNELSLILTTRLNNGSSTLWPRGTRVEVWFNHEIVALVLKCD